MIINKTQDTVDWNKYSIPVNTKHPIRPLSEKVLESLVMGNITTSYLIKRALISVLAYGTFALYFGYGQIRI